MDSLMFTFTLADQDAAASTLATADANSLLEAEVRSVDYDGPPQLWLSLHTSDPTVNGNNEVVGGSYARQPISFGPATLGQSSNTTQISFVNLPACQVKGVALYSQVGGGTPRQWRALSVPINVAAGGSVIFTVGGITYSVAGE